MKIFVSSTYIDLIEYRKAVERAVNLLDQQFKGMEYFGARDEEPKVASLKNVEQCDVFVGIYAHRYGTIPDGDTKSITEQEFDHARKIGKPILCYRVKPDQPWSPTLIERGDAEKKLQDFLKRIEKDFVRQEFTTPEDLLARISPDLSRLIMERGGVAVIAHPLPPVPYFMHTYPLQANFTGREKERALLTEWFTRDARAILSWVAIGGMGKSALAWVWTQEIFSLGMPVEGVLWWSFYDERDFGQFLARAIEYASGGALNPQSISSDRARVDALTNLLRQKRFLFVLDGFERVLRAYARLDAAYRGDEVDADALNDYRACADPNVGIFLKNIASGLSKVLITTRLYPRELDDLNGVRREELAGMDAADAVEFFHAQGVKGARAEIIAAGAPYAFHPLTLRLLAGTLAQDPRYNGDIRHAPKINPLDAGKNVRILEFAYNSLPAREQQFISQLSAFRSPLTWDALHAIFVAKEKQTAKNAKNAKKKKESSSASSALSAVRFDFQNEDELARTVLDLEVRGLYLRDKAANTYDLHPVIRRYCYDRLSDKTATHARLREYFATVETPEKITSLTDLMPVIELYHHTVRAGRYTEAEVLFYDRLATPLYYQLGAYETRIELLRALFPEGEDNPPRLKKESDQAWTLNELANSYAISGQPRRAVPLYLASNGVDEKRGEKKGVAIGLGNVATQQLVIGALAAAEQNLRRATELSREIKADDDESTWHYDLGRVLCYCGKFREAEEEFEIAFKMKSDHIQAQGIITAYRALRALLMGNASAALEAARKARELAEECARTQYPVERDFVRAEWLIGAALNLTPSPSPKRRGEILAEAEQHLQEALARDRAINMMDHEAPILLEFARLRVADARLQMTDHRQKYNALMQEAFDFANEALQIAERCEYRLHEAEIQNFLAEWWKQRADDSGVGATLVVAHAKAKQHAERAKERAWCDGPPHYYKVAYERAEKTLRDIDAATR